MAELESWEVNGIQERCILGDGEECFRNVKIITDMQPGVYHVAFNLVYLGATHTCFGSMNVYEDWTIHNPRAYVLESRRIDASAGGEPKLTDLEEMVGATFRDEIVPRIQSAIFMYRVGVGIKSKPQQTLAPLHH